MRSLLVLTASLFVACDDTTSTPGTFSMPAGDDPFAGWGTDPTSGPEAVGLRATHVRLENVAADVNGVAWDEGGSPDVFVALRDPYATGATEWSTETVDNLLQGLSYELYFGVLVELDLDAGVELELFEVDDGDAGGSVTAIGQTEVVDVSDAVEYPTREILWESSEGMKIRFPFEPVY